MHILTSESRYIAAKGGDFSNLTWEHSISLTYTFVCITFKLSAGLFIQALGHRHTSTPFPSARHDSKSWASSLNGNISANKICSYHPAHGIEKLQQVQLATPRRVLRQTMFGKNCMQLLLKKPCVGCQGHSVSVYRHAGDNLCLLINIHQCQRRPTGYMRSKRCATRKQPQTLQ